MSRWGLAVGPQVLRQVHDRVVKLAHENGVIARRRMRVDTIVVETNIHYPTDSTLLGDGVWGVNPDHEEDHGDRRRGRNQAA